MAVSDSWIAAILTIPLIVNILKRKIQEEVLWKKSDPNWIAPCAYWSGWLDSNQRPPAPESFGKILSVV